MLMLTADDVDHDLDDDKDDNDDDLNDDKVDNDDDDDLDDDKDDNDDDRDGGGEDHSLMPSPLPRPWVASCGLHHPHLSFPPPVNSSQPIIMTMILI